MNTPFSKITGHLLRTLAICSCAIAARGVAQSDEEKQETPVQIPSAFGEAGALNIDLETEDPKSISLEIDAAPAKTSSGSDAMRRRPARDTKRLGATSVKTKTGDGAIELGKTKRRVPEIRPLSPYEKGESHAGEVDVDPSRTPQASEPQDIMDGRVTPIGRVQSGTRTRKEVEFVYVSRGAWLIDEIMPHYLKLHALVAKYPEYEVYNDLGEVMKSLADLSALIATDDLSTDAKREIATAVRKHRRAVMSIERRWTRMPKEARGVIDAYLKATFLEGLDSRLSRVPPGALRKPDGTTVREVIEKRRSLDNTPGETGGFKGLFSP